MNRSIKITLLALLTALASVVSLTPAHAASGELVRRAYQAGANWTSVSFNPVVDSNGRWAFGEAWAKANCTNVTTTVKYNPYFNSLGSTSGHLRMIQYAMAPSISFEMYQATSTYYPLSGSYSAGPSRGYTTFRGGVTTAFSLNFDRWIRIDKTSTFVRTSATFIATRDYSEPYCGVTISPRWYRG